MARPPRIEFAGAVYHVTSRGDRREPIFVDDTDRAVLLTTIAQALERYDAAAIAYCLMGNHYHLVLQTRRPNLSRLMRHVNGVYTQGFNRRHRQVGHVFQGRFNAILVDSDTYLLTLCRYVELNPVRAGWVTRPLDWAWSSCRAHVGLAPVPPWLDTIGLHAQLLGRPCRTAHDARLAAQRYAALLGSESAPQLWPQGLREQIYLGDADFVARMQALARAETPVGATAPPELPHPHPPAEAQAKAPHTPGDTRITAPSASSPTVDQQRHERRVALWRAYTQDGITMKDLAARCGLSVAWVSRQIAEAQKAISKT